MARVRREERLTGRPAATPTAPAIGATRFVAGYFEQDKGRDALADQLLADADSIQNWRWGELRSGDQGTPLLLAEVRGSHGAMFYNVCLHPARHIGCTCLDFVLRGGYCKHLRAAHKKVSSLRGLLDKLCMR
jgi:hypothetical protein